MPRLNIEAVFGFDGRGFEAGMSKAEGLVKNLGRKLAAAFSIAAITAYSRKVVQELTKIGDMAKQVGVTAEQMQVLEFAAKQTGATLEQVATAIGMLADARLEALKDPKSEKGRLLGALGISPDELRNMPDAFTLFERVAEVFRTSDFGANRMAVTRKLLGESGTKLLPMMEQGMKGFADRAREAGQITSDEVVAKIKEAGEKLDEIGRKLRSPVATALAEIYGWVLLIVNQFEYLKNILSKLTPGNLKDLAISARMEMPAKKRGMHPAGPVMGDLMETEDFARRFLSKVGDAIGDATEETNKKLLLDAAVLFAEKFVGQVVGAAGRAQRADDVNNSLTRTTKSGFKPSSDELARIGGFVGRGNIRVQNVQEQQLAEARKTAQHTGRIARKFDEGP